VLTGIRGPLRSPFRYPGGKSWLAPLLVEWLRQLPRPSVFVEPFLGGGSVGLAVADERLAGRVVATERDPDVAAVWSVVISPSAERLARHIETFAFSEDAVRAVLAAAPQDAVARAFRTIVWNRVSHGGRMTRRAGMLNAGERGRGISSRWYPATLAARIRAIAAYAERLDFSCGDGMDLVAAHVGDPSAFVFLDPPYTAGTKRAGTRLYTFNELDHEKLFALVTSAAAQVVLTYDDDPTVRALAAKAGLEVVEVVMRTTHHERRVELLIGNALGEVNDARSWDPGCPDHGTARAWWNGTEQDERLRDLQRRAAAARTVPRGFV
jgi:DNA adenine methylase